MADARREAHPHDPSDEQDQSRTSELLDNQDDPLEYPQLSLNTSFTSLLTHSIPSNRSSSTATLANMPSSTSASPAAQSGAPTSPPPSSLSESWVISDVDFSQDDDLHSEQTDISSLLEVRSSDDDHSVRAEDDTQEEGVELDSVSEMIQGEHQGDVEANAAEHTASAHGSMSLSETSILPGQINLDVYPTTNDRNTYAVQMVKGTDPEVAMSQIPEGEPYSITYEKVAMTLSNDTLKDRGRRNLQVLFMGPDYYSSMRESVVNKIADAFVTSNSSQDLTQSLPKVRYHIVPDCFGPGSEPATAEAIPIESQLEVLNCHSAVDQGDGRIMVRNAESDTRFHSAPSENGHGFIVHERQWTRPDFAVVVVSNTDDDNRRKSSHAMFQFARNLKIPLLVLMMEDDNSYHGGPFPMEPGRARRMFGHASRDKHESTDLPLNLDTFFRLNTNQLSRHLNFLAENSGESCHPDDLHRNSGDGLLQLGSDTLRRVAKDVSSKCRLGWVQAKRNHLHFIGLLCFMLLSFSLASTKLWSQISIEIPTVLNKSANLHDLAAPVACNVPNVSAMGSLKPSGPSSPLTIDGSSSATESFDVERVDNEHLVIRVPHRPKKARAPNVTILRNDQVIEADVEAWQPDMYSIHVAEHELYGNLTIRLWTKDPRHAGTARIYLGTMPFHLRAQEWLGRADSSIRQLLGRPDDQQRVAKQANNLVKAATTWVQLRQAQLARLDKRREAFNEFLDQKGAGFMHYLSASSAARSGWSDWATAKLADMTQDIARKYNSSEMRRRLRMSAEDLHDNLRSETLSAAQDRVQGIAEALKKRNTQRKHG
jgi:hypothetical protein